MNKYNTYKTIEELAQEIVINKNNSTLLIYANNGTGKTTLSNKIKELYNEQNILCFSSFFEEYFSWSYTFENAQPCLCIYDADSFIHDAIINQGLEVNINNNFRKFISKKIDINFKVVFPIIEEISFSLVTGDNEKIDNIKISKGEEALFIWAVFYSILEQKMDDLIDDNASDDILKYIIIDDPVTSLEDEKIVLIALQIREKIISKVSELRNKGKKIGLLITTHNRQFYNVLFNAMGLKGDGNGKTKKLEYYNDEYILENLNDSPFGYHLVEISIIKKHLMENIITRNDFQMFRNVLEKTSTFLGYTKWSNCINESVIEKERIISIINIYSHNSICDLEDKNINNEEFLLFKDVFEKFIEDYKWEE